MNRPTLTIMVEVKIDDEAYNVRPPFIIGRVEAPNEELDYLAIKTLDGNVLYKFSNVRCKWGCDPSKDYGCVSHNHIMVEAEGSGIRVKHIGRTKTYLASNQELTADGIFIDSGRLVLNIPGFEPHKLVELSIIKPTITTNPIIPSPDKEKEASQGILCKTLCQVYDPINAYLALFTSVVTDKDLEELRETLVDLRGKIRGARNTLREAYDIHGAGILENLDNEAENIVDLINVAQPDKIDAAKLRGNLREMQSYIESMRDYLKCKCK